MTSFCPGLMLWEDRLFQAMRSETETPFLPAIPEKGVAFFHGITDLLALAAVLAAGDRFWFWVWNRFSRP